MSKLCGRPWRRKARTEKEETQMEMSRELQLSVDLTVIRLIHRIMMLIAYFFDYFGWA